MLTRFWFTFRQPAEPSFLNLGCGITAYDLTDAQKFLREQVFPIFGERVVDQVIEDIDVSTLEQNHVRPNLGNPAVRGVWFPAMNY